MSREALAAQEGAEQVDWIPSGTGVSIRQALKWRLRRRDYRYVTITQSNPGVELS